MPDLPYDEGSESVIRSEHISPIKTGDNIEAKRVALYAWGGSNWQRFGGGGLVSSTYDYIAATYPDSLTEVYVFKTGGSSGTTVNSVTVVYTDSTKANISTVART